LKVLQVTMKHDSFDAMYRILCRLYIHLAFTYSVGPSSVVRSELGPTPPSPPMRVLKVPWSHALSLVCEVALRAVLHLQAGYANSLCKRLEIMTFD
jgi:hypothetical protein